MNGTNGVQIKGNLIGVGPDGLVAKPNGVGIGNASNFASVTIGGQGAGEGNVIARNTGSGIPLFSNTSGIVVSGNDIFLNGLLGIDQNNDGLPAPPNTNLFPIGSNGSQNYPTIASVTYAGGNTTISGTMQGFANSSNTLEFFSNDGLLGLDEGSRYAGTTAVADILAPGCIQHDDSGHRLPPDRDRYCFQRHLGILAGLPHARHVPLDDFRQLRNRSGRRGQRGHPGHHPEHRARAPFRGFRDPLAHRLRRHDRGPAAQLGALVRHRLERLGSSPRRTFRGVHTPCGELHPESHVRPPEQRRAQCDA